jgi:UDP-glucose 4-epimerase
VKNVAIFGGLGFIGRSIARVISPFCKKVLILDNSASKFDEANIETYECDINDLESLPISKLKKVDSIIYLISTSTPGSSNIDIPKDISENLLPFINLLELTEKFKLKRFIFASSGGAIYSNFEDPPFSEGSSLGPKTSYGIIKTSCEFYLKLYAKRFGYLSLSLRISNPYGPGQLPKPGFGVVPTFLNNLIHDKKISLYGEGESIRDFVYIDDVANAFLLALKYDGVYEIFNIGTGQGVSINDLLSLMELKLDVNANREFLPLRKCDKGKVFLSIRRAKDELKWRPMTTLSKGLDNYLSWLKNDSQ